MTLPFATRIAMNGHKGIFLLELQAPDGSCGFAYMEMDLDAATRLDEAMSTGDPVELTHYGAIITGGAGEPDAETRSYMERYYHFNHGGDAVSEP